MADASRCAYLRRGQSATDPELTVFDISYERGTGCASSVEVAVSLRTRFAVRARQARLTLGVAVNKLLSTQPTVTMVELPLPYPL
jgi:hypothetical protein